MASSPDWRLNLNRAFVEAISRLGQIRDPMERARVGTELVAEVQERFPQLAEVRARAMAEAVQWPGQSLATVAQALGLSKQAVARVVTPDLRDQIAADMRTRLAGPNPPPTADPRLRAAFVRGAAEGRARRR